MPAAEDLPAEIRNLAYRNRFELSHSRWESDVEEMVRRLDLQPANGHQLKQVAREGSTPAPSGQSGISAASAILQAKPPQGFLARRVRLTRRQTLGIAALAVVGTGATIAAPSIRRLLTRPALRTISFDAASVDEGGVRKAPERYSAAMFTEVLGLGAGLDMLSIPEGSYMVGSPSDEPERQPNEGPQHPVTVTAFFIGASPVTQAQWAAVVLAHSERIHRDLDPKPSFFRGIDLPVESISWSRGVLPSPRRDYREAVPPAERGRMGVCLPRRDHDPIQRRTDDNSGTGELLRNRRRGLRRQRWQERRLGCLQRRKIHLGCLRSGPGRAVREHFRPTGSGSVTCMAMSGNTASTK
jgi:sulfatase-modifying factor enzyme 1